MVSNIVTRLLKAGAPPDARDDRRATPLHAAAYGGKPEAAALLFAAGAASTRSGRTSALRCSWPSIGQPAVRRVAPGQRSGPGVADAWARRFITRSIQSRIWSRCCSSTVPMSTPQVPRRHRAHGQRSRRRFGIMKLLLDHGAQIERHQHRLHRADGCGNGQVDEPSSCSNGAPSSKPPIRRALQPLPCGQGRAVGDGEVPPGRGAKIEPATRTASLPCTRRQIAVTRRWWSF